VKLLLNIFYKEELEEEVKRVPYNGEIKSPSDTNTNTSTTLLKACSVNESDLPNSCDSISNSEVKASQFTSTYGDNGAYCDFDSCQKKFFSSLPLFEAHYYR
jgi:hypothetical protein